ncbi:MAG TPA: hypothetical protein VGN12_09530 [Pirellulales bacterium]
MGENSGWSSTNVLLPGAIALALAITSYLTYEPTLTSVRPAARTVHGIPPPPTPDGMEAFYSRLWEDPLLTSYNNQTAKGDANAKDDAKPQPTYTAGPVPLNEDWDAAYKDTFTKILKKSHGSLLCVPVLVPGGPYADDGEARMRTRYAIQMGLARAGYELAFPMQMSYVDVPVTVDIDDVPVQVCAKRFRVPVKIFSFRSESKKDKGKNQPDFVVVLWINEDEAGSRLLNVVDQVVAALFRPKRRSESVRDQFRADREWRARMSVRVIGPSSSDGLRKIYLEQRSTHPHKTEPQIPLAGFRDPKIYSPRATISHDELEELVNEQLAIRQASSGNNARAEMKTATSVAVFPPIIRTIGDDNVLIEALIGELKRRNHWLPPPECDCKVAPTQPDDHYGAKRERTGDRQKGGAIVLVSEQDTLYGRTFSRLLDDRRPGHSLYRYSFFRGLDGAIPGDRAPAIESELHSLLDRAQHPVTSQDGDNEPRPTGKGQADYLRRLESKLVDLDDREWEHGIAAIGVVGTDQYDKLLFLRALRRQFPRAVFFTTDLDADFAHPSERLTTRNVVVASHFGLQLSSALQWDVPPFRDCYQTSTFFAALLALGPKAVDDLPESVKNNPWGEHGNSTDAEHLKPLVYEIGLDGPYQLTIPQGPYETDGQTQVQPDSPRSFLPSSRRLAALLMATVSLVMLLIVSFTWPRRLIRSERTKSFATFLVALGGMTIGFVTLFLVLWALELFDHHRDDGEPFSWNRGISLWPTILIQLLAGVTAFVLFLSSCNDLKKLRNHFWKWANPVLPKDSKPPTSGQAFRNMSWQERAAYVWDDVLTFNWHAQAADEIYSARKLCAEYVERSQWWHRMLRVVPQVALFVAFTICLFQITALPTRPFRGWLCYRASSIAILVALFSPVVLSFFMIDAMQLCRRYIRLLEQATPDWQNREFSDLMKARVFPSTGDDQQSANAELTPNDAEQKPSDGKHKPGDAEQLTRKLFTVHVIADSSHVVGKLILYPFIVVFLLFIARSPMFDYLTLGAGLITIWVLLLAGAAMASISMRVTAAHTRDGILAQLRNELAGCSDTRQCDMIKQTIKDIADEQQGAFRHWSSDPVFGALVILLGGGGSLVAIEQLLPWMLM